MIDDFVQLNPLNQGGQRIKRCASIIAGRPFILFQKQGSSFTPHCEYDWPTILAHLNCGPVIELEPQDWPWSHQCAVNFNCHAMAIGASVGVTPSDWLEGLASPATLGQNPTGLLLDRYYELLHSTAPHDDSICDAIVDNNVFVVCDSKSSHFIHSGIVRFIGDQLVAISKFGEGPILLTSIELIKEFYAGQFDEVRWYRYRNDQAATTTTSNAPLKLDSTLNTKKWRPLLRHHLKRRGRRPVRRR